MNRREALKLLIAGLVIDPEALLWTPSRSRIFVPQRRILLASDILGIQYHENNGTMGTWLGIQRSTEPWPWLEMSEKLMLDANQTSIGGQKEMNIIVDSEGGDLDRTSNEMENIQ